MLSRPRHGMIPSRQHKRYYVENRTNTDGRLLDHEGLASGAIGLIGGIYHNSAANVKARMSTTLFFRSGVGGSFDDDD